MINQTALNHMNILCRIYDTHGADRCGTARVSADGGGFASSRTPRPGPENTWRCRPVYTGANNATQVPYEETGEGLVLVLKEKYGDVSRWTPQFF